MRAFELIEFGCSLWREKPASAKTGKLGFDRGLYVRPGRRALAHCRVTGEEHGLKIKLRHDPILFWSADSSTALLRRSRHRAHDGRCENEKSLPAGAAPEEILAAAVLDDQKSSVRPVETALSVAPPSVSLN